MVPPKLDKQNEAEVSIFEDEIFKKFLNKKPKNVMVDVDFVLKFVN